MNTPDPPLQTIDPREVIIAIPSKQSALDVFCVAGLCNVIGSGRCANQPLLSYGGSNVAAVRMSIADQFLYRTQAQWLVMIDDDIGFRLKDWDYLFDDGDGELAVCAEYLQKVEGELRVAHFGCGFARVHRSVFEKLKLLNHDDGQPMVRQCMYAGRLMHDFFPQGVNAAGEYRQEDHGFWTLVKLAEVPTRVERRTCLAHSGRFTWHYSARQLDELQEEAGAQ